MHSRSTRKRDATEAHVNNQIFLSKLFVSFSIPQLFHSTLAPNKKQRVSNDFLPVAKDIVLKSVSVPVCFCFLFNFMKIKFWKIANYVDYLRGVFSRSVEHHSSPGSRQDRIAELWEQVGVWQDQPAGRRHSVRQLRCAFLSVEPVECVHPADSNIVEKLVESKLKAFLTHQFCIWIKIFALYKQYEQDVEEFLRRTAVTSQPVSHSKYREEKKKSSSRDKDREHRHHRREHRHGSSSSQERSSKRRSRERR